MNMILTILQYVCVNRLKRHVVEALTEMSIKLIAYHLLQAILEVI